MESNVQKTREALANLTRWEESDIRQLETLAQRAIGNDIYGGGILLAIAGAIREGKEALAFPPRNCDRFADSVDAQIAFLNEVWLISVDRKSMLERDKLENWTPEMKAMYAEWLMEMKDAKEGGDKCEQTEQKA